MNFTYVECCGSGSNGLLFQPSNKDYPLARTVVFPYRIRDIVTSGTLSCSIDEDDNLYCWKDNIYKLVFRQVKKVACGWTHILILTNDQVFAFGQGPQGQLGLGDCSKVLNPEPLNILNATDVVCGFRTSFILTDDGFFAFGENSGFQLGFGHKNQVKIPEFTKTQEKFEMIASGNKHTISFHEKKLFIWGTNNFGQLGINEKIVKYPQFLEFPQKIKKICCGWNHSVVLTDDKNLYLAGKGDLGQQGNGKVENQSKFHLVLDMVEDIFCATENNFAVRNGEVLAWGWNEHGNLLTGDFVNRYTPYSIFKEIKKVYCGGAVSYFI
jgi:alpha-tubulin suppressor-like RCC1 family protein